MDRVEISKEYASTIKYLISMLSGVIAIGLILGRSGVLDQEFERTLALLALTASVVSSAFGIIALIRQLNQLSRRADPFNDSALKLCIVLHWLFFAFAFLAMSALAGYGIAFGTLVNTELQS